MLATDFYNYSLIKLDWLAACIARRVVGAALVVFLKKSPKPPADQ
jgi:hypothetical protein